MPKLSSSIYHETVISAFGRPFEPKPALAQAKALLVRVLHQAGHRRTVNPQATVQVAHNGRSKVRCDFRRSCLGFAPASRVQFCQFTSLRCVQARVTCSDYMSIKAELWQYKGHCVTKVMRQNKMMTDCCLFNIGSLVACCKLAYAPLNVCSKPRT